MGSPSSTELSRSTAASVGTAISACTTGTCREQLHRAYFIIAADPDGHGLVGMSDRVTAIGGPVRIESPAGGGTPVAALLPL